MKNILIFTALLWSTNSFSTENFTLTQRCSDALKKSTIETEVNRIKSAGQVLTSAFTASHSAVSAANSQEVLISVYLEEPIEGRRVTYKNKTLRTDAEACSILLKRRDFSACRYSSSEGPESITSIPGMKFAPGRSIKPNSQISAIEQAQIRTFIGENTPNASIADLIADTDDKELSTGILRLPNGQNLNYYGAYGGDNPFGVYLTENTTQIVGNNSDGSVCIRE